MENEGILPMSGGVVSARVNPPTFSSDVPDIKFVGASVSVRASIDGELTAKITGQATYLDRTAQYSVDISPPESLVNAINELLDRYGPLAQKKALQSAAEALGVAMHRGEV